jgi:hypothetical protein
VWLSDGASSSATTTNRPRARRYTNPPMQWSTFSGLLNPTTVETIAHDPHCATTGMMPLHPGATPAGRCWANPRRPGDAPQAGTLLPHPPHGLCLVGIDLPGRAQHLPLLPCLLQPLPGTALDGLQLLVSHPGREQHWEPPKEGPGGFARKMFSISIFRANLVLIPALGPRSFPGQSLRWLIARKVTRLMAVHVRAEVYCRGGSHWSGWL